MPVYFPEWIDTIEVVVKKENAKEDYVNCNSEEAIVYLANQACLTLHVWLSKRKDLNKPDRIACDFDPADDDFEKVRKEGEPCPACKGKIKKITVSGRSCYYCPSCQKE